MDIDGPMGNVDIFSPDCFQKIVACYNFRRPFHEESQNLKFLIGEFHDLLSF